MNNNNFNRDELYHHGVKGMKWGVRRNRNTGSSDGSSGKKRYTTSADVAAAKKKMKVADKAYNKSFNKAYRDTNIFTTLGPRKLRERNDRLWEDAGKKAEKYREARKDYKMLKKSYKQAVKEESKRILEGESFVGRMYDVLTDAHKYQAKINIDLQDYDD